MSDVRTTAAPVDVETSTRQRVLELVVADGPVSVARLAEDMHLTTAAVRRHVAALEASGHVVAREPTRQSPRRGRPARYFVATSRGQSDLPSAYPDLATKALEFLARTGGAGAVEQFAEARLVDFEARYSRLVTATDTTKRAEQLAQALSRDGYVASVRPVPGSAAVQLCQGHCPVQHVAQEFPQLCEAEARVFARLIGSHTQRLLTLAGGGHVCTTNVPLGESFEGGVTDQEIDGPNPLTPHYSTTDQAPALEGPR